MDSSPLVSEQIEVGARFLREFAKYRPVQSAFWYKDSDQGEWHLYVASDQVTDDNFDVVYEEVGQVGEQMDDPWFDVFQVKVIGTDHPLARAAQDLQRRYPGRVPGRFPSKAFGAGNGGDVYLYAVPLPAPTPGGSPSAAN